MKTKLFLCCSLAFIGLTFSTGRAAAQWSPAQYFGDGMQTAVAMHPSGLVLEGHRSHASTDLWYHVGKMNGTSVTWGRSQRLPASGSWPNLAITKEGYVLFVWSDGTSKMNSNLYYRVGKIDPNGVRNQSINWLTEARWFDSGFNSSTAMNDNGVIVEVHESGSNGVGLYYRAGHFANPAGGDFNIVWDSGSYGTHYGDGINPHIALNNRNEVVEVHQVTGERLLHYHRGVVLSGGIIDFRPSQRYDNDGNNPSVALFDDGTAMELHKQDGKVYARMGILYLSNQDEISWTSSVEIAEMGESPAIAVNRTLGGPRWAVGTWTLLNFVTRLDFSFATIP